MKTAEELVKSNRVEMKDKKKTKKLSLVDPHSCLATPAAHLVMRTISNPHLSQEETFSSAFKSEKWILDSCIGDIP